MPRMAVPGFAGPTNVLRSTQQDIQETVNRYLEPTQVQAGAKVQMGLLPTPGVKIFAQVNDAPGATIFYQDGRCFGVTGSSFWEVFMNGTTVIYGSVTQASAALPASIVSNGTAGGQLLICSGGNGYVFVLATNVLTLINGTNFPGTGFPVGTAQAVEFMDGFGVVLVAQSRQFLLSNLEDFTTWNPLNVAERSEGSDNIMTMRRNHREIWFLGTKTGEVWYDSGDPLFPFAPVPGTFIEYGSASVSSCRVNGTIAWIAQGERGIGVVSLADGYTPTPVSKTSIDHYLQSSTQLAAAKLFAQQQDGHVFLWLRVPDLDKTPVYDYTVKEWHMRALWDIDDSVWNPHLACAHAFAFNKHLVLDAGSGYIYELSLTAYTDAYF